MKKLYNQKKETPALKRESGPASNSSELVAGAGMSPLPCLYSNNSIEPSNQLELSPIENTVVSLTGLLTDYRKRQAHTLYSNVKRLIEVEAASVDHVGFLTLTFPDNVTTADEAYSRYRSMNTNFLSKWPEIKDWICVKERQKRGAWHYHLLVVLKGDIRTGVDFDQIEEGNYRSAGNYLKGLWKELREKLPLYGFGRSELLPVKSNAEAMGRYIGKYISKHIGQRKDDDKGVRLINYSRNWIKNSVNFAWFTDNSKLWRRSLKAFAAYCGCEELYQLSDKLGPGWAYRYLEEIQLSHLLLTFNAGVVSKDHEDALLEKIKEKMENRKKVQQEKDVLLYENNTKELGNIKREEKRKKDRKAKLQHHKNTVLLLLSQKHSISEEDLQEVRQWVSLLPYQGPLIEAYEMKQREAQGLLPIPEIGENGF